MNQSHALHLLFLVSAAAMLFTAALLTPISLAERVLPWVEPGWRPRQAHPWSRVVREVRLRANDHVTELALPCVIGALVLLWSGALRLTLLLTAVTAVGSVYITRRVRARRQDALAEVIAAEAPVFAEFLALCVSAGVSVDAALARSTNCMRGLIAHAVDGSNRAGQPRRDIEDARMRKASNVVGTGIHSQAETGAIAAESRLERLRELADQSNSVPLRQLVEALSTGTALGTPVAEVLLSQAQQLRAVRQQQLLSLTGRREVLMLVPIVFIIFPVVVAVALFPAWAQLNGSVW